VAADLLDAVAPEFLEECVGENDGHHGLADDAGGGHGADVAPLDDRVHRLLRGEVHRLERRAEGRERLHRGPDDDRLAVRHSALQAAGVVRLALAPARGVEADLGVDGRLRACSSHVTSRSAAMRTPPISVTWLRIVTPNSASNRLATPATATRAVVSRALERSRTLRMSRWPYFMAPARSAWPGRGRVTCFCAAPGSGAPTAIVDFQFSQSRLAMWSVIGLPSVEPHRTPERMRT